jgi:hypothetical protein
VFNFVQPTVIQLTVEEASMLQNKQIVMRTFSGYLDFLAETQPALSAEAACQVAALLTQAEFGLQLAENHRQG